MSQYTTTASGQGAIMSVTGTGDTTVTTSNGVATVTSGSGNANAILDFVDDFIGNGFWENIWTFNNGQFIFQPTTISGHPGIFEANGSSAWLGMSTRSVGGGTAIGSLLLGEGIITLVWYVNLEQLSTVGNPFNTYIGLSDDASVGPPPINGLWFTYTDSINTGHWQIVSSHAGTLTTVNTTVLADTNWHRFKIIVNAAGTSVAFYIDDVQVSGSPITTHLPAIGIAPMYIFNQTGGGGIPFNYVDLCTLNVVLNTPR